MKSEASEKSLILQRNGKELRDLLVCYCDLHQANPADPEIDEAIRKIDVPFKELAQNQRGVGEKIVEHVISRVTDVIKEIMVPSSEEHKIPTERHPLFQLIYLIDKFKKTVHYGTVVQEQITHTLNLLEIYSPLFRGLIVAAGRDPHKNLTALRAMVIVHIQTQLRGAISLETYEEQMLDLHENVARIVPGSPGGSDGEKIVWVEGYLGKGSLKTKGLYSKSTVMRKSE